MKDWMISYHSLPQETVKQKSKKEFERIKKCLTNGMIPDKISFAAEKCGKLKNKSTEKST